MGYPYFELKSGEVWCNNYDDLKTSISVNNDIPPNEIIGLFNIFDNYYSNFDFSQHNKVIVKISPAFSNYIYGINFQIDYSTLKNQCNSLENTNTQLNNDLNNVRSNYNSLQSQYNNLQSLNDSNKRQISQLQSQNSTNESKINNLIANNDNLNKELQKVKDIHGTLGWRRFY